ncbi:MAG TPA: wax ester/triacylglycerol synthase domain-containing protein, partial [Acidimicrobiales bacterium]|nr:wax ester/triacylglycerol synthase domain-containing protein [Acidimicrobiales bacterium]
ERHMSDQEALMWNIEKDPWMNPSGAILTIFDRPVDFDLLVGRIRAGLARLPRLRERVVPGLGRLSPPVWVTDPDFDLSYHARLLSLPAPGSIRQLLDLATRLYEEPYDRTRPLWMFYAIEGVEGGKGALLVKQHHSVADGIGALRMAEMYTDLERTPPPPPDVDLAEITGGSTSSGADIGTSILDTASRTLSHNLRRGGGILTRTVGDVARAITHPAELPATVAGAAGQVLGTLEMAGGGRGGQARSSLWTNRSRRRHLESLRLSVEDAKAAAKALGGTLNDLFVAGAALGAFAYHAERDAPIEVLNMTFVVSTRADKAMGGNAFTPVPIQVPRGGELTAEERLHQLRDLMAERRRRVRGRGPMSAIAGIANILPTSVTTRIARQQATKVDLATSNLRGAPFQTYIAGAQVLRAIPLGPVAGTAANLTTISQNGWLDMGLLADPAAIADPGGLAANIDASYRELLAAGGIVG